MNSSTDIDPLQGDRPRRVRKRGILKALQKQMEFYFGNANLRHDHFLRREIQNNPDGYVPLSMIAGFKRIEQISQDISLITKAVKNSDSLQFNEDSTMIRRNSPLPRWENVDSQTVYVERLPPYADQEWLREVFSLCGEIDYISLPRYKNSGEIKGFAFIEYSSAGDAEKACKVLNTLYVRSNKIKVGDCCERIATSLSEQRMVEQGQAKNCKRCHDVTPSPSNLEQFECRGDIQTPKKRLKCEVESSENTIQQQEVMTHSKDNLNMTNEGTTGIESVVDHAKEENSNKTFVRDNAPNKEKRRRKRKKKIKEAKEFNIPPLYVISKKEWICLKETYKSLQRGENGKLKLRLQREDCSARSKEESAASPESSLPERNTECSKEHCFKTKGRGCDKLKKKVDSICS